MEKERWKKIEQIYSAALEHQLDQRQPYLDGACGGDAELRREVDSLLGCQPEAEGFIDSPAIEQIARELADSRIHALESDLSGSALLHYRVEAKIGQGGMGVIYRARDTRLNRLVAIKVLPPDKMADPERRRRFIQEAKAASTLNHPNIVTIHDIARQDDLDFIVMEYVAGKTLDQFIGSKGLGVNPALKYAIQVADALARAHQAGIVHRDLKPSNVMVDEHGLVKVLDWGLAKLLEPEPADPSLSALASQLRTEKGAILGTAAYMSPEQVEGREVDARSDVFSFGALLYEMVSGRRAFQGDSAVTTLAAVLHKEPPPLPSDIPHDLTKAIARCLRKDPDRRWLSMSDLRVALLDLDESSNLLPAAPAHPLKRIWPWLLLGMLLLSFPAAMGWIFLNYFAHGSPPPSVSRLSTYPGNERFPSFSPDGQQVAFSWDGEKQNNEDIYIKMLGVTNPLRLTTDPAPEQWPAWSPDGKRIAFQRRRPGSPGIRIVSPLGSEEQKLADLQVLGQMSWSPDGKWLAVSRGISFTNVGDVRGIFLIPADGSAPRRLTNPKAPAFDCYPSFSADGKLIAYASCRSRVACDAVVQPLDSSLNPQGEPRMISGQNIYITGLSWSRDGNSLIYSGSLTGMTYYLWRIPIAGGQQPERLEFAGFMALHPSIAPLSNRMAFSQLNRNLDVWRYRFGGVPEPFLTSSLPDFDSQFSPDGRKIAFASGRSGDSANIWITDHDGSLPVQLTRGIGRNQSAPRWSPDGRLIAFNSMGDDGLVHAFVIDANGGKPRQVTSGRFNEYNPTWSRDGQWIYFYSDRTGRNEIWRIPFREGAAQQMTENGGCTAMESTDGKTLFYAKQMDASPLFTRSLNGGPERRLVDYAWGFSVFDDGIYFIGRPVSGNQYPIEFYEFASSASRLVVKVEEPLLGNLSVSPDRKTFLFCKTLTSGIDLMLIENFR